MNRYLLDTHALIELIEKKVQKTPKKEITKAERIREEYLKSQNKQ